MSTVAKRSLDDAGSLEGATPEEIDQLAKQRGWWDAPTRNKDGTRWHDPASKGADQVRHHGGNPRDPELAKRGPYARLTRGGVKHADPIPLAGNPTLR